MTPFTFTADTTPDLTGPWPGLPLGFYRAQECRTTDKVYRMRASREQVRGYHIAFVHPDGKLRTQLVFLEILGDPP